MSSKIELIKEMLKNEPNDSFLLHALALEHIKIEDINEAISIFENLLSVNPNYVGSYYHLAHAYLNKNELEKANEVFEKGMKIALEQKDNHSYSELKSAWEAQQDW